MDIRHDPLAGFAEIASGLINTAHRIGRPAVTTIGRVVVEPNFPGIIPAKVGFTIDARHPDPQARHRLYAMHEGLMSEVAARRGLEIDWEVMLDHEPSPSDPALVSTLQRVAAEQGVPFMTMASGAGQAHRHAPASDAHAIEDNLIVSARRCILDRERGRIHVQLLVDDLRHCGENALSAFDERTRQADGVIRSDLEKGRHARTGNNGSRGLIGPWPGGGECQIRSRACRP